jgi:hypothetical protein
VTALTLSSKNDQVLQAKRSCATSQSDELIALVCLICLSLSIPTIADVCYTETLAYVGSNNTSTLSKSLPRQKCCHPLDKENLATQRSIFASAGCSTNKYLL